MKDNRRAIVRWSPVGENDKMMDVNDAVLCMLHLEFCCSENKLAHLLNEGFTHLKTKSLVEMYMGEDEKLLMKENRKIRSPKPVDISYQQR